ncbi:MAG: GerMN domain-containing protein [Desulfobacterales bacterium]|nr:GerMN domain-containing protein [Desulfobacterales bacterium]
MKDLIVINGAPLALVRAAGAALAALVIWAALSWAPGVSSAQTDAAPNESDDDRTRSGKVVTHLYFSDRDNAHLMAENRVLPGAEDPAEFGKTLIHELVKGSRDGLTRTLPAETAIRALYVSGDGTAYVDMSEELSMKHPGGCGSELLTIYSVVNTLILNVSEINAVKILIGGRDATTLAGHIDLRFPFQANMLMVR